MCGSNETSVGSRFCVMRSSAINKGDLWLWHSCPSLHSFTISHPLILAILPFLVARIFYEAKPPSPG